MFGRAGLTAALAASATLLACATPYQEKSTMGGYEDWPLPDGTHKVRIEGNTYLSTERAKQYAERRAGEVCGEAGYELLEETVECLDMFQLCEQEAVEWRIRCGPSEEDAVAAAPEGAGPEAGPRSEAVEPARVAVLEVIADPPEAVEPRVLRLIADEIRRAVITELDPARYPLIGREAQQVILDNFGVESSDFCDAVANCELKAAKMIQARYLFASSVTQVGSKLSLVLKLFDVDKANVLGIERVTAEQGGELSDRAFLAASEMMKSGLARGQ